MEEGPDAVRAEDVKDGLENVELLLDDGLTASRCWKTSVGSDGRSDSLAGLCEHSVSVRNLWPAERQRRLTLTTQMGFERIEVAAPAMAEVSMESRVVSVPLLVFLARKTIARVSSKLQWVEKMSAEIVRR